MNELLALLLTEIRNLRKTGRARDDLDSVVGVGDDLPHRFLLPDQVIEIELRIDAHDHVDVRQSKVRVHEDHPFAEFRVRQRQVCRKVRLSDTPLPAGHRNDTRGPA